MEFGESTRQGSQQYNKAANQKALPSPLGKR